METKQTSPVVWLGLAIVLGVGLMALFGALLMPWGGGFGMMGFGMGWGVLFMAIPVVILVLILIAALGGLTPSHAYVPGSPALETLNLRYARGDLSRDEYVRMRAELEGKTE